MCAVLCGLHRSSPLPDLKLSYEHFKSGPVRSASPRSIAGRAGSKALLNNSAIT